jgi:Rad3-related DNA helicase
MLRPSDFPPPTAFGAPARFSSWRPEQADAVRRILESTHRFTAINAPTGIGKSLIAMMVQKLTGARVLVLTSTRGLQNLYAKEWGEAGLFDIRGQRNYTCVAVEAGGPLARYHRGASAVSVDRAPCHAGVWCRFKRSGGCTYYDDVRAATSADLVITNYAYWMVVGSQLGAFDYLILDEADEADAEVRSALHLELSHPALRQIGIDVPAAEVSTTRWKEWSVDARRRVAEVVGEYTAELEREDAVDVVTVGELRRLKELQSTLDRVGKLAGEWLVAPSRRGPFTDFDPIWPAPYAEEMLFRGVERVVLMSATLTRKDLQILGVPPSESEFFEYDSPFPLASRPVYILDLGEGSRVRVDSRLKDYGWLVSLMDSAMARRLDRKILIHSVSYKLTREIMRLSRFRKLMISCSTSDEKPQMLADFRRAVPGGPGSVLIHPGLKIGESFPLTECETVLIPKVPFLDMRDPIMKRREAEDPNYGGHLMMKALAQSAGRHVRSALDRGDVIIFDDHARWAVPKYAKLGFAPRAFTKALRWVTALPEPLEKL